MAVQLIPALINAISNTGYAGIFFLIAGESALLPIPSEVVLPFAGFLVYSGKMVFWLAVLVAVAGQLFGSVLSYGIGFYGGRPLVLKYGKYFLLSKRHFEHVEAWFNRYGPLTVFIARLLPVVRTVISFPAGIAKLQFRKFVLYSTAGIIPWSIALVYAGLWLGEKWQSIIDFFSKIQVAIILGLVLLIVWWVWISLKENAENKT